MMNSIWLMIVENVVLRHGYITYLIKKPDID